MVRKEERREGRGARDPASPRPLSRPSGRAASRLGLPGRYIGGIFQIYYPLICYIGEREKESSIISLLVVPCASPRFVPSKGTSSPHSYFLY